MTGAQAKEMFLAKYYAATNVDAAGWEDAEIEVFLQEASMNIVYEAALSETFDLISKLIKTGAEITAAIVASTDVPNGWIVPITAIVDDYLFYVRSSSNLTKSYPVTDTTITVPNEFIQAHEAVHYFESGDHTPYFRSPKAYLQEDGGVVKLTILVDGYTTNLNKVFLTYVTKPEADITGTPYFVDVNQTLHVKIIELAVKLAVESLINTQKSTQ